MSKPPEKSPYIKNFYVIHLCSSLLKRTVEKFKIVPKTAPAKKDEEEKKTDDKKISMGKGYFSLEEAPVNGSSVYTIV